MVNVKENLEYVKDLLDDAKVLVGGLKLKCGKPAVEVCDQLLYLLCDAEREVNEVLEVISDELSQLRSRNGGENL